MFDANNDGMIIPYSMVRPYTVLFVCSQKAGGQRRILNSRTHNAEIAPARTDGYACYVTAPIKTAQWATDSEWSTTALTSAVGATTIHKNGSSLSGVSVATVDFGLMALGAASTACPEKADANIAEILVFTTALSTADRQSVERYLNAKWAIY